MTTNNKIKKKTKSTRKHFTLLDGDFSFQTTESFKTLRTNLVFSLSTKKKKIFAVSSADQHEGKSTIAANLALTFAQMQAKVLLIDGDLRKPVQHKIFKLKNKVGLTTLLCGLHSFKEVLNENIIPGLDVMTSGPIPPNPSEMLGSDNMKVTLNELSEYYDYIIIDTPPVNIVTDALTLSQSIAGVVMVAMSEVTTYDAYQQAIDAIEFANGNVLGAVITRVSSSTGKGRGHRGLYSYNYSYGYSYTSSENESEN
jgi:capsular exopolysaccharide synthesis family protein